MSVFKSFYDCLAGALNEEPMADPGEHLGWLVPTDIADRVRFEEYRRNHQSTPGLGSLPLLDEITKISGHADDNSPLTPDSDGEFVDTIALITYEDMLFARWSKTIIKTYIEAVKSLLSSQSIRLLLSSTSPGQVSQQSLSPSHRPSQRTYGSKKWPRFYSRSAELHLKQDSSSR